MRFFFTVEYDGRPFNGWQRQPGCQTVQGHLDSVLSRLLNQPIECYGSGRTDAGVHATGQVAHFDVKDLVALPDSFHYRMNRLLPAGIATAHFQQVEARAHARFSAIERRYCYRLRYQKNTLAPQTVWLPAPLFKDEMQEAAQQFLGSHNFRSFAKSHNPMRGYSSHVRHISIDFSDAGWDFHIHANRFLKGQVRAMVGLLHAIGQGKQKPDMVAHLLANPQTLLSAPLAPPEGLTLEKVLYPDGVYN